MRFALLGPVDVIDRGLTIQISRPRHRALLAYLLLNANQVVSTGQIAEAIWGTAPPSTVKNQLHSMISALRRDLGSQAKIETAFDGYAITVQDGQLDLAEFTAAVSSARDEMNHGDWQAAGKTLREALDLWQGDALGGVQAAFAGAVRRKLDDERMRAEELLIEAELAMGRHTAVIGQLRDLSRRFPSRERLAMHLMLALHRSDRRTDALDVARQLRDRLREEQGLDTGESFTQLERAIMRADPALDWENGSGVAPKQAVRIVPRQLPPAPAVFVGRDAVTAEMTSLFRNTGHLRIAAIHGAGGTGKSSLAMRVAHAVADRYPDGQLYVDLRGHQVDAVPLTPAEVLGRFLRALGTPSPLVPGDVDEAAALYRTMLASQSVLVVLDNASDITQILPLLPASANCGVLVTSRHAVPTLEADHVTIGALPDSDAVELIARTAGQGRVSADPVSAKEIAALCDHLPLALKVASARLATDPGLTLAAFRERLTVHRRRLDLLTVDDLAVRACFQASYQTLGPEQQAFRLLGLLRVSHVTPPVMAALLGSTIEDSEAALDRLAQARLVEANGGTYVMHDLLRLFAIELTTRHESADTRDAALRRALTCYLGAVRRASEFLRPGQNLHGDELSDPLYSGYIALPDVDAAMQWLETERFNLACLARQMADRPGPASGFTLRLASALRAFLPRRGYLASWEELSQLALAVARRVGDQVGQAVSLMDLGGMAQHAGRLQEAQEYLESGLEIATAANALAPQAGITGYLAENYRLAGDIPRAIACLEKAIAIRRQDGNETQLGMTLTNAAIDYLSMNLPEEAGRRLDESIGIMMRVNDKHSEGIARVIAAGVYLVKRRVPEATHAVTIGLELARRFNNPHLELEGLLVRATIHRLAGNLPASAADARLAARLGRASNETEGEALANLQLAKLSDEHGNVPAGSGHTVHPRLAWVNVVTSLR